MYLDTTAAAADAHRSQLLGEACRSRLAALATCCHPSFLARHARALLARARSGR